MTTISLSSSGATLFYPWQSPWASYFNLKMLDNNNHTAFTGTNMDTRSNHTVLLILPLSLFKYTMQYNDLIICFKTPCNIPIELHNRRSKLNLIQTGWNLLVQLSVNKTSPNVIMKKIKGPFRRLIMWLQIVVSSYGYINAHVEMREQT